MDCEGVVVAKQNLGAKLAAFALDAGTAISEDALTVTRTVNLPAGAGITTFDFRVTGIVGFLVAKVGALIGREKPKDTYNIVWIIENWEGGPAGRRRVHQGEQRLRTPRRPHRLRTTGRRVLDTGTPRATVIRRFLADASTSPDDELRLARQAAGAIGDLLRRLDA